MKFLIDESADARLAPYLRSRGHDVKLVAADFAPSITDPKVLRIADREQRILITFDRDFGELVFVNRQSHAGVLYFRLGPIDLSVEIARLHHVLTHYADRLDQFIVITRTRVRVSSRV